MTCCAGAQSGSVPSGATHQGTGQFWFDRKPADWSGGQTHEFLTRSPWVRYWGDLRAPGDYIVPGEHTPRAAPVGTLAIRWESAALVREALLRVESKEYNEALASLAKDYYVIAVVRAPSYQNHTMQTQLSEHWSAQEDNEWRDAIARQAPKKGLAGPPPPLIPVLIGNERAARAFHANRLLRPGYEETIPARVVSGENAEGAVDLLMFPRALKLESGAGDIEVDTRVALGLSFATSTFKATFDMNTLTKWSERGL